MGPLDLVGLTPLMARGHGRPETRIALIDGPVALDHADLAAAIREVPGGPVGGCARADSAACGHGTFVAGILSGRRGSPAPAICPGCTLLVRPIFPETKPRNGHLPGATPGELAAAIVDCVSAGARVVNLSLALEQHSSRDERALQHAIDHAMRHGAIVVAAAGNQGIVGSTAITRHPWVIPVIACDLRGQPTGQSNLARSIGRRGLRAPGEGITSLGAAGEPLQLGGTSVAAPFVTGAVALLWSEFPGASATRLRMAVTQVSRARRTALVPSLLDAWSAFGFLENGVESGTGA
jgi:subtilisin family serine protease